jgi:histone deacetylase complex regulatory component SIN3
VRPPPSAFIAESGLEMKVCIGSFKLFFVPETADYYLNRKTVADEEKAKARGVERRKANKEKMDKWVESKLASMDAPAAAAAGAALALA